MKIATRAAFGEALAELWEKNKNIVVLDADLSGSTKTAVFAKKFPDRFFNIWIAEQDMVWTAAWLAVAGKIPVCASFAMFATGRAWEQMRNTVCYSELPVKLIWTHSWIMTWEDWATHQALEDIALMRSIPNIVIVQPADYHETKSALEFLINDPRPAYLRLTRSWVYDVNKKDYEFKLGKNTLLVNHWSDAVLFASWSLVWNSVMAAEKLKEDWINISVLNISSIKPFDSEGVRAMCAWTNKVFTAEDHSTTWWIWSAVAEVMAENGMTCTLTRIWMTTFWESWTWGDLYEKYGFDPDWIAERIKEELK